MAIFEDLTYSEMWRFLNNQVANELELNGKCVFARVKFQVMKEHKCER